MAPHISDESAYTSVTPSYNLHEKAKNHTKHHETALAALSQGETLPGIPVFPSYAEQRRHQLEHMAGAFRVFARRGYGEGMAGHISLRDPENPHTFWTNPLGRAFGLMRASDLVLIDYEGNAIGGNKSRPVNRAGFLIHRALHTAHPHVHAACHMHSTYGKAWSAFAKPLEMINQDSCVFYGKAQVVYKDFGGVVLDENEGRRLADALGEEGKVMTLANHGLLTVGGTVDEAAYLFTLLERSCQVQLLVEAAAANGIPKQLIRDTDAAYTFKMTSDPESLYQEFQPDLEMEDELCHGAFRQ